MRQFFATSADGTSVPYFVVGPQDPGSGPALLTGYGGFEVSLTPSYSGIIGRGWLARGGTYVVANLRGGGEYGPQWHLSAIKEHRHLVYEDFAAVAADLVTRGIATRDRLGIEGGSNGGLLMGVMLTRYPQLFGAIVSQVPLLDMRRYHELLAGASWMAEYGDPREPAEWDYIRPVLPVPQRLGRPTGTRPSCSSPPPGTTGCTPGTPGRWWRCWPRRATTSATTRTSRAATARPPTTSSGRSSGRWCSSSSGSG